MTDHPGVSTEWNHISGTYSCGGVGTGVGVGMDVGAGAGVGMRGRGRGRGCEQGSGGVESPRACVHMCMYAPPRAHVGVHPLMGEQPT